MQQTAFINSSAGQKTNHGSSHTDHSQYQDQSTEEENLLKKKKKPHTTHISPSKF